MSVSSKLRFRFLVVPAVLLLAVLAFAMTPAEPAGAHANQIRSLPLPDSELDESPNRVIVWFSEEIEASLSQVRVLDELAREVDNGDSAISPTESTALIATLPVLENGTYTVVWKNLSTVDGHRVVGSFRFAVGEPLSEGAGISVESQPLIQSAADPWLRWLFFAGALALVGTLTFDMFVVRPLLGSKDQQLSADLVFSLQRVMFRLMIAATALMVVGMLALLVQQAAITFDTTPFGVFGDPLSSVLDSEWGRLWLWRGLAVVVTGMLVVLTGRSVLSQQYLEEDEGEEPDADEDEIEEDSDVAFTESVFGGLALAGGLVVLGLTSFSSHNAAVPLEFRTVATISDFLHLLSSSVWIGGLLLIALATPLVLRASDGQDRSNELVLLLERFSPLAIVSAGALIVTGIFSGYMQVTVPAATNTPYGWTLVTKLLLLVPLFGLASVNSYLISKKLLRSGRFSFRRLVRYEAAVAVLVLVAVGWLAGLEPARQYAARNGIGVAENVTFSDFTEGANIDVAITPGDVGTNDVAITLTDRRGAPITNSSDVRVRLKFLEDDLGEPLISLGDRGDGVWVGSDFNITIGGVYQAEVRVIRPDAFDAITSHRFDAAPVSAAADAIRPTRTVAWTLFAFEIIAIGLLLVLVATPLLRGRVISIRPMMVPGAAFSVIGVALLLNAQVLQVGFPEERFNPFPVNAESIQLGSVSYAETCSACHGVTGLGDGPQSGGLSSPPADLSVHVPLHADSDLFGFIRDGIPGTAMPGQAGNLSEDEMWHLVNFLRTFEE